MATIGRRAARQEALSYGFSLKDHAPADRPPRSTDGSVELTEVHRRLVPRHSATGRRSVDPGLVIRMLPIGYCRRSRSERRLRREVYLEPRGPQAGIGRPG